MNLITLVQQLPPSVIAAWGTALVIPYLSALLTPHKGWWTGIVTLIISFLSGLFTEIAQSTNPVHWKMVFGVTAGAWFVAAVSHSKTLSGTLFEQLLHSVAVTNSKSPPTPTTTTTTTTT